MADPILEIDPAAEATGTALVITTGNYGLMSFNAPAPPPKLQWAGSVDTEGAALAARGHENRTITVGLHVTGATALADLQGKLAKLHREGGTLKYTSPASTAVTADVLVQDGWDPIFDHMHYLGGVTAVQFSLTCKPYLRGAEQDLGDNTETTLPALVFTLASIPGEVEALGRLVADNDSSTNQRWMTWGVQSRYYSSASTAALFYQAENLTGLGGTSSTAGPSGTSGTMMAQTALTTSYRAILSTQASGGGAHMSHIGSFRVYARIVADTSNTGTVTVALEWSEGDFLRVTRNPEVEVEASAGGGLTDTYRFVDLGLVTLRAVTQGTQRWEGRILAKSTATGDDVGIDYLLLIPADEGSGIAAAVTSEVAPTAYVGEDHFTSTTAGNALNARSAPTGGTWATSGDATDFAFDDDTVATGVAGEHIKRTAVSGTNGRYAILGSTDYTDVVVETIADYENGGGAGWTMDQAVIARWTDSSNYLRASFERVGAAASTTKTLRVTQVLSGTATDLATASFPTEVGSSSSWWKIRLAVTATGEFTASVISEYTSLPAGQVVATCSGSSFWLATGGTLATGKIGLWDRVTSSTATTRYYDDFLVWVPPVDAAAFANQSIEVRHDRVTREDSGGGVWSPVSSYQGDYLLVPPSGAESRTARVVVKFLAADQPGGVDLQFEDLSARLFVTPRYLAPPA